MDLLGTILHDIPTFLAAGGGGGGEGGGGIGAIAEAFGVTWPKLLAQIVLFLIAYMVLKKFAFGPILALLEERKARIAEGEDNLERIKKDLAESDERVKTLLNEANTRAEKLITEARESAEAVRGKKVEEATTEATQIISKAREASQLEHERLMAELKRDFSRLVVDTTSKVTGKVLNTDDQKRINEETAAQISL